jgi:hypothetical protein
MEIWLNCIFFGPILTKTVVNYLLLTRIFSVKLGQNMVEEGNFEYGNFEDGNFDTTLISKNFELSFTRKVFKKLCF